MADSLGSGGLLVVEASWLESASSPHSSALASVDTDSELLLFSLCFSTNAFARTCIPSPPSPPRVHSDAAIFFLLSCVQNAWKVASAKVLRPAVFQLSQGVNGEKRSHRQIKWLQRELNPHGSSLCSHRLESSFLSRRKRTSEPFAASQNDMYDM